MGYEQVRTVLEHIAGLHARAAEEYDLQARGCEGERRAMLLDYLATHERRLAEAIDRHDHEADPRELSSWITTPYDTTKLAEDPVARPADDDEATVLQFALDRDEQVQALYEDLIGRDVPDRVRDAFVQLLEMERAHERQLATQAGRMSDL